MTVTKTYIDYLTSQIGIASAGTQEEHDAAHVISDAINDHGVPVAVEEFVTPSISPLARAYALIISFISMVTMIFTTSIVMWISFALLVLSTGYLVAWYFGKDLFASVGPQIQSQNVVAKHAGTGPLFAKGVRPIVVLAHYDTFRVGLFERLNIGSVRPVLTRIVTAAIPMMPLVAVLMFIPWFRVIRIFFVIVAFACALACLILGLSMIIERFLPFTTGAVDNKSSVAALLSVLQNTDPCDQKFVREAYASYAAREAERQEEHTDDVDMHLDDEHRRDVSLAKNSAEREAATESEGEKKDLRSGDARFGEEIPSTKARLSTGTFVRRGYDVVMSLGALPASCELVYQEGDSACGTDASKEEASRVLDKNDSLGETADETKIVPFRSSAVDSGSIDGDPNGLFVSADDVVDDTTPIATSKRSAPAMPEDPEWGKASYRRPVPNIARRAMLFDLPDPRTTEGDPFLHDADSGTSQDFSVSSGAASSTSSGARDTRSTDDNARSNGAFHDGGTDAARDNLSKGKGDSADRPQADASHAQSTDSCPQAVYIEDDIAAAPQPVNPFADDSGMHPSIQDDIAVIDPASSKNLVVSDLATDTHRKSTLFSRLKQRKAHLHKSKRRGDASSSRRRDAARRRDASRRRDVADDENWKGGAARPPLSIVEGGRAQSNSSPNDALSAAAQKNNVVAEERTASSAAISETNKDLRDAVLRMGDEKLICHDIWFVAVGASAYDQAGIKAFLAEHRRDIRGAFLLNLESVGAGSLTILDAEGLTSCRRADRRFERLIQKTAADLHIPLDVASLRWRDTDATPAMRASMRSVTLMGMQDGRSAFSRTPDDTEDAVDSELVHDVVQLICEAIRRS